MKKLNYKLLGFFIAVLFFASCTFQKSSEKEVLDSNCEQLIIDKIKFLADCKGIPIDSATAIVCSELSTFLVTPTPYVLADEIVKQAYDSLLINSNKINNPRIKVNVGTLISNIFPNSQDNVYENYGMRVYPGLSLVDSKKELTYIICTSTNYNPDLENNYFKINSNGTLKSIDSAEAYFLWENFKNNVSLNSKPQNRSDRNFRTSRYYDYLDLKSYLSANNYSNTSGNFNLQFSYGYVSDITAIKLYDLYWHRAADKPEDLTGFTVVLELFYNDTSITNRCDGGNTNYAGGILEIGNPCPPRCKGEGLIPN